MPTNKKPRWTAAQKAAAKNAKKGPKKPYHRGQGPSEEAKGETRRPAKRPVRGDSRRSEDRPRRYDREDRPRQFDRDDRPQRFDRDDRPRRFDRDDRPRRFDRDDRPRRFERDDRPQRFDRDDRPRRFERDDRPRRFDRDDRPRRDERSYDDRPRRVSKDGSEFSGGRRWERRDDQRPARDDRPRRFDRDDRPRRDDRGRDRRDDRRDGGERRDNRRFEGRGPRDDRRGYRPRFDRDQTGYEPQHDPEAERMEADTWVSAARKTRSGHVEIAEDNGFAALGLPERIVERLARDGITEPFPIQEATIPDALAGKDVLGRGQTGSGKTLAFGLPTIARLAGERSQPRRPRALVLVPTRELAMQVSDSLEPLVHVVGLRHKLVAGGLSYTGQIAALDKGVDILIATPGRLVDLLDREAVILDSIEVAILDEADHMADMGFVPAVTRVLDEVPEGGQRLLFSATLDKGVDGLVERYLVDPVTHSTNDATASVDTMEHHILLIDPQHKKVITAELANREGRTVVFCRTKLGADRVARQLRESGVRAAALHGGLTQGARNKVLGAFRTGSIPVLVATDVAARGIHVDDVSVVLQADPPADHKDYLHRSGRTARAGERGTVVTLALPHQRKTMERMAIDAGIEARPVKTAPGDEVLAAAGATPVSGVPIDEADFRKLLDPRPARRHGGTGGPRGQRGGRRDGGYRREGGPRREGGYRGRPRRDRD